MTRGERIASIASKGISMLMHPLVIPLYAVLVIFASTNMLPAISLIIGGIVLINTMLMPAVAIGLMRFTKILSNLSLTERRERNIPLLVVIVGYLLALYILRDVHSAIFIRKFLFAAVIAVWCATAVNYFWKISLHMVAAGGLLALVVLMTISSGAISAGILCSTVLAVGALASARLYLGHHNPLQIAAGFCNGFLVTTLTLLFL